MNDEGPEWSNDEDITLLRQLVAIGQVAQAHLLRAQLDKDLVEQTARPLQFFQPGLEKYREYELSRA